MNWKKLLLRGVFIGLFVGFIAIVGCSYNQQADSTGRASTANATTESATFDWSEDSDCTVCHKAEAESMTDQACNISISHKDISCIDCHDDTVDLKTAHSSVSLDDQPASVSELKLVKVSDGTCLECHVSWNDLASKTTSFTLLSDVNGTIVNPHAILTNYNGEGNHDGIGCANCHKMHSSERYVDSAQKKCQSCHHDGVYECYTCHE